MDEYGIHFSFVLYTSGHDYLDAERVSCLMNTHWNTVWSIRCNRGTFSVFLYRAWFDCVSSVCCASSISSFHVWGSNPRQGTFFDVAPMTIHINRSIKLFKQIFSIGLTVAESLEKEKSQKRLPRLGFEPQTWKRGIWSGTGPLLHTETNGVWRICSFDCLFVKKNEKIKVLV